MRALAGEVRADLFDDYHDMACTVHHDGTAVTAIQAEIRRAPFSTCPGANTAANELVGIPLQVSRRHLYGEGRPQRNCTHIFDLAAFAISHAANAGGERVLDFIVPDLVESGAWVEACLDGKAVHRWKVGYSETIIAPAEYAGRAMFGGFVRWAEGQFEGVAVELALHLQKVVLVARGRRYLIGQENENSIRDEPERIGACYSFSEPQFSIARPNPDYVRDFTDGLPTRKALI
ncbi:hypothetical protein BHE75_00214 [Sphingomonas haloaromaticamans]|uniref:DUF2889 domain-containing protein n=2 Tax=Edaphosphingomonas haloaromaticamans TaxID=653954 RepID=A0A1S1HA85_9SPHN|nr:hypothetical protein BHE75_00214 [Sphingomonas haloaromaticamans]